MDYHAATILGVWFYAGMSYQLETITEIGIGRPRWIAIMTTVIVIGLRIAGL